MDSRDMKELKIWFNHQQKYLTIVVILVFLIPEFHTDLKLI